MKKRLAVYFLFVFIFMGWQSQKSGLATTTESDHQINPHRLIVKADSQFDFSSIGIEPVDSITSEINILQFQNQEELESYYEMLQHYDEVDFIERDLVLSLNETLKTNGELLENKYEFWGLERLGVYKYSDYLRQLNNLNQITVAVIDTGIDSQHPIFGDKILNQGYDFINHDHDPNDDSHNGHGTHVAGIIAEGTKDLANVKILPLKVLNSNGKGFISGLIESIKYAVDQKVDIINLSIGLNDYVQSNILDNTILDAINSGITVVIASGNSNIDTSYTSPARLNEGIIVSSVNQQLVKTLTSNFGESIDVAAPGEAIYSALPGSRYGYLSGTSMAAPHITTVVAMLKLSYPQLTPFEIEQLIKTISIDLGGVGKDPYYGHGIPNLSLLLGTYQGEAGQIETDQSEVEQIETKQPEVEQIETEQPEVEQIETEQPEVEQIETKQPEVEQIETQEPEAEQGEIEQPEVGQIETKQPEIEQIETQQPEIELVEAKQLEIGQLTAAHPVTGFSAPPFIIGGALLTCGALLNKTNNHRKS